MFVSKRQFVAATTTASAVPAVGRSHVLVLSFNSRCDRLVTHHIHSSKIFYRVLPFSVSARHVASFNTGNIVLSNNPRDMRTRGDPHVGSTIFSLNIPMLNVYCNVRTVTSHFNKRIRTDSVRRFNTTAVGIGNRSRLASNVRSGAARRTAARLGI